MRTFLDSPTVRRQLPDGNLVELTVTSATHVYVTIPEGFLYRGNRHHGTAHLFLCEDGVWSLTAPGKNGPTLYSPGATKAAETKIGQALVEAVNQIMASPDGRGIRRMAELAQCNNRMVQMERDLTELVERLEDLETKGTRLLEREADAMQGILPNHYEETV
jgi:hypothetical protein